MFYKRSCMARRQCPTGFFVCIHARFLRSFGTIRKKREHSRLIELKLPKSGNPSAKAVKLCVSISNHMAKIISFSKQQPSVIQSSKCVDAGWLLVYSALWQHDSLPKQEVAFAKRAIKQALIDGPNLKSIFIGYCERILIAQRLLQVDPATWIDTPSIWFYPEHADGFAGTQEVYNKVLVKRQSMPDYQRGISVFAEAYWAYVNRPVPSLLRTCRRRLLRLKEYGLLQLWNNVIMHHQSQ